VDQFEFLRELCGSRVLLKAARTRSFDRSVREEPLAKVTEMTKLSH